MRISKNGYLIRTTTSRVLKCILSVLVLLSLMTSCSSGKKCIVPSPLPDDRQTIPEPKDRRYNHVSDSFDKQFTKQIEQSFDLSRQLRHIFRSPKQAFNVNGFDEVPNSSWFTNRNGTKKMTLNEIAIGPNTGAGPDTTGAWIVTRAKAEGVTPGFHIKDEKNGRYVIKFDPPGYSEMATGAEVVATKLFYAAGYHVPENYIVIFNPQILKLGKKVHFTDAKGKKRFMNQDDLLELLERIHKLPDGRIRALASKYIPGKPMGPYAYQGVRKDDPNDFIPHQHRRELRGLHVVAAWLNHTDTKSGNSFDSYVNENGKSYIRHYLIDFGSTLGSAAHGPMEPMAGHENLIDPHEIFFNILTLGFYVRPFEKLKNIKYPSIGLYESSLFHPGGFKHNVPNPAFENCTNRDGFWGAKLVMSFTDEQLKTAVAQGKYSDPDAAEYLFHVLKERRNKTGKYWFSRINPLDRIELCQDKQQRLSFIDFFMAYGLDPGADTKYRYTLKINGAVIHKKSIDNKTILLPKNFDQKQLLDLAGIKAASRSQWEYTIQTSRNSGKNWGKWVKVYLDHNQETNTFNLLGFLREE